jgi:hypothetical protein
MGCEGYSLDMRGKMRKYTGLSLSFCISDIIRGEVYEEQVGLIISATKIDCVESYDRIRKGYCETYWRDNPREAGRIFDRLWNAGKIFQPRLLGLQPHNIAQGHWLRA